jgi:flagellar protein FliS
MSKTGDDARLAYLQQMVEGASKTDLLLMLLDGALRFMNVAEAAFDEKKWDVVHVNLCKVQDIFHELMLTLDGNLGDIALKLNDLYGFVNSLLIQANIDQDHNAFVNAKALIIEIKSMWEDAAGLSKEGADGPSPPGDPEPKDETPKSINVTG